MPASAATAAERAPRRARYLIPGENSRRGEIVAAFGMAVLAMHVLFAQLTIVLAAALYAIGKTARWRPSWLAVPAGAGLIWALATGPGRAVAGFTAGPRQVAGYLGGVPAAPGRLLRLGTAFAGAGHWLPRQLPLALILATAEVALLGLASRLRADGRPAAPARSGLIVAARRRYSAATVRSGGIVTAEGGCLGIDREAGGLAAVSWREAEGGVLAAGGAAPGVAGSSPAGWPGGSSPVRARPGRDELPGRACGDPAAQAGHRRRPHRQPVAGRIAGRRERAADAPFYQFGEAGQLCYEPLRGGDPARAASLVLGMIDWPRRHQPAPAHVHGLPGRRLRRACRRAR